MKITEGRSPKQPGAAALLLLLIASGLGLSLWRPATTTVEAAQVTLTPGLVVFPTGTELPPGAATEGPSPTPLPPAAVMVEAYMEANLRAAPDINSEQVGMIVNGDLYPLIGQASGRPWLQIEYEDAPGGKAWVYVDLVEVLGDISRVPFVSLDELPTPDMTRQAIAQTAEVIQLTPGAVEAATATAFYQQAVSGQESAGTEEVVVGTLPTFTEPPSLPQYTPIPETSAENEENSLPPIYPIGILTILGLASWILGFIRARV